MEITDLVKEKMDSCEPEMQILLEKLIKNYEKKSHRIEKIIKQSDTQQFELLKLNNKLEASYEELKIASETDPLTKLLNRYKCESVLEEYVKNEIQFSAIFISIDNYHEITEKFDIHISNQIIVQIGKIIQRVMPSHCDIGKWSEDIFLTVHKGILLDDMFDNALNLGEVIEEYFFDNVGKVTVSIGVAQSPYKTTLKSIIKSLHNALKKANKQGTNQVSI